MKVNKIKRYLSLILAVVIAVSGFTFFPNSTQAATYYKWEKSTAIDGFVVKYVSSRSSIGILSHFGYGKYTLNPTTGKFTLSDGPREFRFVDSSNPGGTLYNYDTNGLTQVTGWYNDGMGYYDDGSYGGGASITSTKLAAVQGKVPGESLGFVYSTSYGAYPYDGVGSDGYYYRSAGSTNNAPPVLVVTTTGDKTMYTDGSFTISGTVQDSDNQPVTISADIGGATKSVTVTGTTAAQVWQISWDPNEISSGTYINPVIKATDGLITTSVNYAGKIEVKPQIYYYWSKFSVVNPPPYVWSLMGESTDDANPNLPGFYASFNVIPTAKSSNVSGEYFSNLTASRPVGYYKRPYNEEANVRKFTRTGDRSYTEELLVWNSNTQSARGTLIQSNIRAAQNTYPDNGKHTDGFWYTKIGSVPNEMPVVSVTQAGSQNVNLKPGTDTITISGTVSDPDNDTLTISATIGGIAKSVVLSGTQTAKPWSLVWRTSDFAASGSYSNVKLLFDDGKDGLVSATYTGKVTIDTTPLYYWDKYSTKNQITGYSESKGTTYRSDASTINGYRNYTFNTTTGKFSGVGEYEVAPTYPTWAGTRLFSIGFAGMTENLVTNLDQVQSTVYSAVATSSIKIRNDLISSNILDIDKTYPDDGLHTDGFWYVKKATNNMFPVLTVDNSDMMLNASGKITLTGTAFDSDGDTITINATIDGVTKSTTVKGSGSWHLDWAASEVPAGRYTAVSIEGSDGNEGIDKITYNGLITVDKTAPVITVSLEDQTWTSDQISLTVQWLDQLSGINGNERKYKLSTSQQVPANWDTSASDNLTLDITDEGAWYLHIKAADQAGNATTKLVGPFQYQKQPEVPTLRVNAVGADWSELGWSLPSGSFAGAYTYKVENTTTGQSWDVTYPTDKIREEGLVSGTTYQYRIKAANHVGESNWSNSFEVLTLPAAVEDLTVSFVSNNSSTVDISFAEVDSAVGYLLSIKEGANSIYEKELNSAGTHQVTDLEPGKQYTVTVSAKNASGNGQDTVLGFLSLPEAPGEFQSAKIKETEVELMWNSSPTATLYELLRGEMERYSGNDLSYTDEGLESGTEYDYSISAKNDSGFGDIAFLKGIITLPGKTEVSLDQIEKEAVKFSITPVRGTENYVVLVNGMKEMDLPAETEQFEVDSLASGTEYTFEVYAQNRSGYGVSDKVTVRTLPDSPEGLEISEISDSKAKLTWEPVQGADKYKVSISDDVYEVSGTELFLSDLTAGTTYQAKVTAGNVSGYGESIEEAFLTLPASPNSLHLVEVQSNQIILAWDKVTSANKYVIYNESDEVIGETEKPTYSLRDLKPGKTYNVYITAINDTGEGQKAGFTQRTLPGSWTVNPDDPKGDSPITVGDRNENSVVITVDPIEGADQYKVVDGEGNVVGVITTPENATEIGGLESAKEYEGWIIIPINDAGEGKGTPVPTFVTLPSSDFKVTTTDPTTGSLTIKVESSLNNEIFVYAMNGKEIHRGKDKSFTVKGLGSNQSYTFSVWTENSAGDKTEPKTVTGQTSQIPVSSGGSGSGGNSNPEAKPDAELPAEDQQSPSPNGTNGGTGNTPSFQDIGSSFAKNEILTLSEKGIVKGTSDSAFEPDRQVTRVEFASMLVRALELQESTDTLLTFQDIQRTAWYAPELGAAILNGVAHGFSDKEFRPFDSVTREQAAKMLSNSFYKGNLLDGDVAFKDAGTIAAWAKPEIKSLTEVTVINGYPDGSFKPKKGLTRAESAVLIYRALVELYDPAK
ncbi:fibronectin type III domain-containing protein [Paenibacillus amylolyticus]|uniref:Fibronectin type III domain-containing protein n=1 Tax=Paenibacillus amylolyticus TaxID=1451 RepID=A0ABD8B2M3_PAEAM